MSLLLAGLCSVGFGAGVRAQEQSDLDRLKRELAKAGPEAADGRFDAAETLISRKDLAAHGILHERLWADDDPDGVRKMLLGLLEQRLRRSADPVLGVDSETEEHKPLDLQKAYVAPLAHLLMGSDQELVGGARSCLLRLDNQARYAGIEAMFAAPERVSEAIRACRESRLLNTGKLLAARLGDPEHGPDAQEALLVLTFERTPFADENAFDQWYRARQGWTYTELAEAAARRSRGEIGQMQEAADEALRGARGELVVALASVAVPQWDRIRELCLRGDVPGQTKDCLAALRPLLTDKLHEGNGARERREFHSALAEQVAKTSDPTARALMLEVSALLLRSDDPAEKELRDAVCARLREALAGEQVVRIGALRGLRRFPNAENRAAIIEAMDAALTALPEDAKGDQGAGPRQVLTEALSTLVGKRPVWVAPAAGAPESARLVDVIRKVFAHPAAGSTKRQALEVARLRDAKGAGVPELFGVLADLSTDAQRQKDLRRLAFIYLRDAASDEVFAQRYVLVAIQLLADDQNALRRLAAERLKQVDSLPVASDGRRDRAKAVFDAVRARLDVETSPEVYGSLVETFGKVAAPPLGDANSATNAIQALIASVDATTKEPVRPEVQFRLEPLLTELTVIASDFGDQPAQWIPATETLVRLKQRVRARAVLAKRRPSQLTADNGVDIAMATRGWNLALRAANLKGPAEELGADEATEVLACMGQLSQGGDSRWLTPDLEVLRLDAWGALAQHDRVLEEGPKLLAGDPAPTGPQADRVRLRLAAAKAAKGSWAEVAPLIGGLPVESPFAAGAATLADQATVQLAGKAGAVAAADVLMRLTPAADPQFRARVLLWAEARTKVDAADPAVVETLEKHRSLFEAGDCPEDLKKRFAALHRKPPEDNALRVGGNG